MVEAIDADRAYGPTLGELVTPQLIQSLKEIQTTTEGFGKIELEEILKFLERYHDQHIFRFLHHTPKGFLNLDHALRNQAALEATDFSLPLLNSTTELTGNNSYELKRNLLQAVFTPDTLQLTKPEETLLRSLRSFDLALLQDLLNDHAELEDLEVFCTPSGQSFMYWLYHSLNLHLISEGDNLIDQVNLVKKFFSKSLGDPARRARIFREKIIQENASILFTQESDEHARQALEKEGFFLPVEGQNPQDGTYIFLRSELWDPHYEILSLEGYQGFLKGRVNLILATHNTGQKFLLASAHGHSTRAADGRLQLSLIMDMFHRLQREREYEDLQLLIGMDANTKTESDVEALLDHLESLGLVGTRVGPTTAKKRMVTAQHSKAGKLAIDQEDYLITVKPECGGKFLLSNPTVGFQNEMVDPNRMLPDIENLSDHYPVGAALTSLR